MINDLVDNKYYCYPNFICDYYSSASAFELLVAEYVYHCYYAMYYDSDCKNFKLDEKYMIENSIICSKIIGIITGFHKYNKNKKYKDGYYLVFSSNHYVRVVKIMNNKPYEVELLKNGIHSMQIQAIYSLELLGSLSPCYISDNTIYLTNTIEEI